MKPLVFPAERLSVSREYYESHRPRFVGGSIWAMVFLLVASILWSALFEIEEVVRGDAMVQPLDQRSIVHNSVTGTVAAIHVRDNMDVTSGFVLYRIDTREAEQRLEELLPLIEKSERRLTELSWTVELISDASPQTSSGITLPEFRHRLQEYELTMQIYERRKDDISRRIQRERLQPPLYSTRESLESLLLEADLLELEHDQYREETTSEYIKDRQNLEFDLTQWRQERYSLETQLARATVKASIAGTVQLLRELNPGDWIASDEIILQIIPRDSDSIRTVIELQPKDIAGIRRGMITRIQFSSLPPSEFGFISGVVSSVPADIIEGRSGRAIFPVEARIPRVISNKNGSAVIALRSGMNGEARIIRRKKSILFFILALIDFRQIR